MSITAADRVENARTGSRPVNAFPRLIALALFTAAVGSPGTVAVTVTALGFRFAFSDMVNADPPGGGNTGVGIGLPIAATDRVKQGDTDLGPPQALTDRIALSVFG